jgi:integrase
MKAVPFTIKAYMQAANKAGLAPLGLRYTVAGKVSAVALGTTVTAKDFDKKLGLVTSRSKDAQHLNSLIRLHSQFLEQAAYRANSLAFADVKPLYLAFVADHEKEQQNTTFNNKLELVQDWARLDSAIQDKEQAEATVVAATETLKKLAKKGRVVETEQTKEFDALLAQYPNKFIVRNASKKQVQTIESFIKRLRRFSKETGYLLTFASMNSDFYSTFGQWLCYGPIDAYDNYFGKNVSYLKTFLKWCEDEYDKKVNKAYKSFKVLKEEKDIFYLNDDELELLANYKDNEACPAIWIKYIDFTLFQCFTGLRYSDCARSRWKIENDFLRGTAKKNKGNYMVPLDLDTRILEILVKYNYNMHLFAEQNYNDEIKKIMLAVYEFNNFYTVADDKDSEKQTYYRSKLGVEIEFKKYKHELLSSHCNRRSFCTRAVKAGYGESEILEMLGSKSMTELRKYIKVEESNLKDKAKRLAASKLATVE